MSGTSSTHEIDEICITNFHLENLNGKTISRARKDNTKVHLREIECDGVDWIHLAQDMMQWMSLVSTESSNEHSNSIEGGEY
jgi:hypothetical protein